jgi:uncharacterized tellurite resistance protein B-like protein
MFDKLNQWLESTLNIGADNDNEQHTAQLAAAILLIEVSRADFEISSDEQEAISAVLIEQFTLSKNEADKILQYALDEHAEYTSSHAFIRLINEELDTQSKLDLLKGLWTVAYVDGVLDKYEEYHIRKIADWLYLSHSDFIRIKHQVLNELNIEE